MEQSTFAALSSHFQHCLEDKSERSVIECLDFIDDIVNFDNAIITLNTIKDNAYIPFLKLNHSYSDPWVSTYVDNHFANIDPVVKKSLICSTPFVWSECYREEPLCEKQALFIEAANDFGMKDGITFSIPSSTTENGATLCSLAGISSSQHELAKSLLYLSLPIFGNALQDIELPEPIKLSKKEVEVLQWATEGKTAWETGVIMTLSEATIKYHLKTVFRKLKVKNKAQAIAFALTNRLV